MTLYELIEQVKPGTPAGDYLLGITIPQLLELEEDPEDFWTEFLNEENEDNQALESIIWRLGDYAVKFAEVLQEEIPKSDWGDLDTSQFKFFAVREEHSGPVLNLSNTVEAEIKLLLKRVYNPRHWKNDHWVKSYNGILLRGLLHTHPQYCLHDHFQAHVNLHRTMNKLMHDVEV